MTDIEDLRAGARRLRDLPRRNPAQQQEFGAVLYALGELERREGRFGEAIAVLEEAEAVYSEPVGTPS